MSRFSTEQSKRGGVAPSHFHQHQHQYHQQGVPSSGANTSYTSSSQQSTSSHQHQMDDTATSTTIASTSNSNSNTGTGSIVGSDSSLPRYRPDYSRSQHPLIPSTRPSSAPAPQPFPSTMSPEQIRFEKYVNRFAVHDPRSSPVKRQKDAADPSQTQQPQEGGLHSPPEMLSVSERINRFNKGGGQPQHQQLPIPQQQHQHHISGTPPRNAYTPSKMLQRSESLGSSSDGDHIRRSSSGYDSVVVAEAGTLRTSFSNQRQGYTAHEPLRAKSSSSTSSYNPSTPQTPKLTVSTSTVTTATNLTASTSASGGPESIPNLERREAPSTPPPSRFTPSRYVRPLMSEGPRSYSYDQPRPSSTTPAIETQSPARVAELRKKLWDTNETLQVAVPPSLHYVGARRDASELSLASEQQRTSRSATKTVLPKGGPEMAGRYGQRSRSHSPKRPQYATSTFKSRYYEAALASRRAAVPSSPQPKPAEYQPKVDPDRVELERQYCDVPQQKPDVEAPSRHNDSNYKHNLSGSDELPKQDYGPQRGRQPHDYGPRKVHNLDYRDSELQRMQEHLQSLMVNATAMAEQQQQQNQLPHQSAGTPNKGDEAGSSMWRRQPMPSLVDERSDTTGEASVAKLVAKLNSISRDNPAEALAQIDSILRAESKSSSGDMDQTRLQTQVKSLQEEKKDEYEGLDDVDSDSDDDDETSMSSITNPSYAHALLGPQNLPPLLSSGRPVRPNALQTYQQQHPSATEGQEMKVRTKNKQRHTPPATIQVKEASGNRVVDHFMGRLDQLLTNENTTESRNAAAIAMKIRMWDEMSTSKSPSKLDEALSIVPSLQEEIISATTDELGSIVTPADAPASGSVASSQRESPLIMSCLATPPSSLLMPGGSTDNSNQGSRQDVLVPGLDVPHSDLSDAQDELFERGRQRSREESPPPRELSRKSLTPRRNHPWDHHHPRNRSESREPKPSYEETSMKNGEGLELRPIDPAPVTSPRNVLSIPKEAVSNAVKRSPRRGHEQSSPARKDVSMARRESDGQSAAQVRVQPAEVASSSELNSQSEVNLRKTFSKQREPKTPPNVVIGSSPKARGFGGVGTRTSVQPVEASGGGDDWNSSAFKGSAFEVDPKLLKENDEFGFPIRIKQEESRVTPFLDDFDPAWEPLTASTFFPTKNEKPPVAQQRQPQRDNGIQNDGANSMPNNVQQGGADRRPKSPGRARFNILRMKKSQDSVLHSPSFDNPKVVDGTRQNQLSGRTSPEKHRDDSVNRSPEKSKFSILKRKKSRDDSLNKYDPPAAHVDSTVSSQPQKRPVSKSPRPKAPSSSMPSRGSPSRERSGSFNIVQRFNRLRREKESED